MFRLRSPSMLRLAGTLVLFGMLTCPTPSSGFRIVKPIVHQRITFWSAPLQERSLTKLEYSVKQTDYWYESENRAHFDSEQMEGGSQWVADCLNLSLGYLPTANKEKALEWLGVALHGIQDFYAHTNWVENTRNFHGPLKYDLLGVDNSGYFTPGSFRVRADFTTSSDTALVCDPDPGPELDRDRFLTSGYFPNNSNPAGKCTHKNLNKDTDFLNIGGPDDKYKSFRGPVDSHAGGNYFELAQKAAQRHTEYLFGYGLETSLGNQIPDALRKRFGTNLGNSLFDYLLNDQAVMVFLVNITPSMAIQMDDVKGAIINKTQEMTQWCSSPTFRFATFGEGASIVSTTSNQTEFTRWINAIHTYGTDDNEHPLYSLDRVLGSVDKKGFILVYTDAPPESDEVREKRIIEEAKRKGISIGILVSRGYSPIGTAFQRICDATGGYLFYWTAGSAPGSLTAAPSNLLTADDATSAFINQSDPRRTLLDFVQAVAPGLRTVPVEDSVAMVEFVVTPEDSVSDVLLHVWRPGGALVQQGDPDATILDREGLKSIRITSPAPGNWGYELVGSGACRAFVSALSPLQVTDARFERWTESSGPHVLEVPIEGKVAIGDTVQLHAEISRLLEAPDFELVSADGALSEPLALTNDLDSTTPGLNSYGGPFQASSAGGTFYMRVRGYRGGYAVQRTLLKALETSTLDVRPTSAAATRVAPGCSVPVSFDLRNFGAAGNFSIEARTNGGLPVAPQPRIVTVGANGSLHLEFTVQTPWDSIPIRDELLVTATSSTDRSISNTGSAALVVYRSPDVPGDVSGGGEDGLDEQPILRRGSGPPPSSPGGGTLGQPGGGQPAMAGPFRIVAVSPNPAKGALGIDLNLKDRSFTRVIVLGPDGRRVRTLFADEHEAGPMSVAWNGLTDSGARAPVGIYYLCVTSGKRISHRSIVLLRE